MSWRGLKRRGLDLQGVIAFGNNDNTTAEKMVGKEKHCIQNGIVVHSLTHTHTGSQSHYLR